MNYRLRNDNRSLKRLCIILCLLTLALSTSLFAQPVELTLFFWGDRLAQSLPRTEIADGETLTVGGIGLLGGMLKSLRAENPVSLTLVSGGDIAGSLPAYTSSGLTEVKNLNKLAIDAYSPGIEEFGFGKKALEKSLKAAKFPVVCANITIGENRTLFKHSIILKRNSTKIAITGLVPMYMIEVVPRDGLRGMFILDPVETAQKFVSSVRDSVDIIVILSHLGWQADSTLAADIQGIDFIIEGHNSPNANRPVGRTKILSTVPRGEFLGQVKFGYDPDRRAISDITCDFYPVNSSLARSDVMLKRIAENDYRSSYRSNRRKVGELMNDWVPNPDGPSNFAYWAVDALRNFSPSARLALLDNTSIQSGIPRGKIRKRDIIKAFPFDQPIVVAQLSGEELLSVVKRQLQGNKPFLSWSGLQVEAVPGRITKFTVGGFNVADNEEYALLTTGHVWDNWQAFTGLSRDDRPSFQLPQTLRGALFEALHQQGGATGLLDNRWVIRESK